MVVEALLKILYFLCLKNYVAYHIVFSKIMHIINKVFVIRTTFDRVVELYFAQKITLKQASELLGMSEEEFVRDILERTFGGII